MLLKLFVTVAVLTMLVISNPLTEFVEATAIQFVTVEVITPT